MQTKSAFRWDCLFIILKKGDCFANFFAEFPSHSLGLFAYMMIYISLTNNSIGRYVFDAFADARQRILLAQLGPSLGYVYIFSKALETPGG